MLEQAKLESRIMAEELKQFDGDGQGKVSAFEPADDFASMKFQTSPQKFSSKYKFYPK